MSLTCIDYGLLVPSDPPVANRYASAVSRGCVHVCRVCDEVLNGLSYHRCLEVEAGHAAVDHDLSSGRGVMCSGLNGKIAALVFYGSCDLVTLIHTFGEHDVQLRIRKRGVAPSQIVLKCAERINSKGEKIPVASLRAWKAVFPETEISVYSYETACRLDGKHMADSLHCWKDPRTGKTLFA
eukprot:jgi/Tetstr1/464002/TSEL_008807.t1